MRRVSQKLNESIFGQQLNKSIFGSNRFLFLMVSAVGGAGVMLLNPKTVFCPPPVLLDDSNGNGRFSSYRDTFATSVQLFLYGPEMRNYLKLIDFPPREADMLPNKITMDFYMYLVEHYQSCLDALTLDDYVKFEEAVKKLKGSILVEGEARAAHFLIAIAVDTDDRSAKNILAAHFSEELVHKIEKDRGGAAPMQKLKFNAMFHERRRLLAQLDESAKASSPAREV